MSSFYDIELILKKYNQEHILRFYNDLKTFEKNNLIEQIKSIDFEKMNLLYKNSMIDKSISLKQITPIKYIDKEQLIISEKENYTRIGLDAICKNELAVVTLAGGLGSRLRDTGSKRSI